MKSRTPKNARWYSVFGLPVLMCVEYISALKVATSYKFFIYCLFVDKILCGGWFSARYATFIACFVKCVLFHMVMWFFAVMFDPRFGV